MTVKPPREDMPTGAIDIPVERALFDMLLAPACTALLVIAIGIMVLFGPAKTGSANISLFRFFTWPVLLLLLLSLVAGHELVHGLAYQLLGKVQTRYRPRYLQGMLTVAYPEGAMPLRAYRWALALPAVLTMPVYLSGPLVGHLGLTLVGWVALCFCISDLLLLWALRSFSGRALVHKYADRPGMRIDLPAESHTPK